MAVLTIRVRGTVRVRVGVRVRGLHGIRPKIVTVPGLHLAYRASGKS